MREAMNFAQNIEQIRRVCNIDEVTPGLEEPDLQAMARQCVANAYPRTILSVDDVAGYLRGVRDGRRTALRQAITELYDAPTWWPTWRELDTRQPAWSSHHVAWVDYGGKPDSVVSVKWFPDGGWVEDGRLFGEFAGLGSLLRNLREDHAI